MTQEENHSGIPTRAIHEAYLDMQRSLKAYREAKDNQVGVGDPHGEFQQAVLTLYEILRPHLKQETVARGWWDGELPEYTGNGEPPDPEDGKGILQVQEKRRPLDVEELQDRIGNLDRLESLEDWHRALDMNGSVRISGVGGIGDTVVLSVQEYQKGLRQMDNWETKYKRVVESKGGFMSDKKEERVERQRIPIDRLKRAARELSDVAGKLGLLSHIEAGDLPVDEL